MTYTLRPQSAPMKSAYVNYPPARPMSAILTPKPVSYNYKKEVTPKVTEQRFASASLARSRSQADFRGPLVNTPLPDYKPLNVTKILYCGVRANFDFNKCLCNNCA
ncbi:Hypothetical_protein [Hexamita inflata]|uniref:Hypothetical_protein n=1 Tax=Hexamita inflata TaxID=28002 RepID=A0AA86PUK7_9EUKA|nr:Hypothetical protein HINF_LOCUS31463 [Hexamita inflata]